MSGRYAVGLDLGDGESALAWVSVDEPDQSPMLYQRSPDEISVVTAIALGSDGEPLLGEAALRDPEARQVRVNFKTRPKRSGVGIVKPLDSVEFAQLFLIEFSERHKDIATDCIVYIGHPAGWEEDSADLYREQLQNAVYPVNVQVVAESQAAFLYVSESPAVGPDIRPVLVIDLGSSTVDFTLIESQESQAENLPYGDGLGCRMIDEALCDAVVGTLSDSSIRERLNRPTTRSLLLWICRRRKEACYAGIKLERPDADTGELKWLLDMCWDNLAAIEVSSIVNGMWLPKLREELIRVREHLGSTRPSLILTTGGGSRMPFIADLCRQIFVGADVNPMSDPSFAVARGLASYGRWRHRITLFREEVSRVTESTMIKDLVHEEATSFAQRLYISYIRHFVDTVIEPAFQKIEAGADPKEFFGPEVEANQFAAWLDSTAGASARAEVFTPLEAAIDQGLNPRISELCRNFQLRPDALDTHLLLPTGVFVHPRGRILRAFESLSKIMAKSMFMSWYKSRAWRAYVLGLLRASTAINESAIGRITANRYQISQSDVTELTEAIQTEVHDQLIERVRSIEGLLAQR